MVSGSPQFRSIFILPFCHSPASIHPDWSLSSPPCSIPTNEDGCPFLFPTSTKEEKGRKRDTKKRKEREWDIGISSTVNLN